MAENRLDFAQTWEGLFSRALEGKVTPRLKERLRSEGLNLDAPLEPGYPAEKWPRYVGITLEELYPNVPRERAANQLGRVFFEGYQRTLMGKALAVLMRAIGPSRTLSRMGRSFQTGNNYTQTRTEVLGPGDVKLWFNEVHGLPWFFAGVIESGAEIVSARNCTVEVMDTDGHACTLRIRWTE